MGDFPSDSVDFSLSDDETDDVSLPLKSLSRKFRIRLNATNLPSSSVLRGSSAPDTFAVITSVAEPTENDSYGMHSPLRPAPLDHRMVSAGSSASMRSSTSSRRCSSHIWGTTEVVPMSRNPQWTKTIAIDHVTGSSQIFFVHLFLHTPEGKNVPFGTAQYNVADLTSLKHMVQMKRLRCGGNIYCRLEPVHDASKLTRIVQLQFQAMDLIPSGKQNLFQRKVLLDTVLEISKPEWSGWIVVHRSPPVKGSLNPLYDTACISLEDLCGKSDKSNSGKSYYDEPFHISVYACKADQRTLVGIAETTLRHLLMNGSIDDCVNGEGRQGSSTENEIPEKNAVAPVELKLQRSLRKLKETGRIVVQKAFIQSTDGSQSMYPINVPSEIEIASLDVLQPLPVPHGSIAEKFSKYIANGCQIDFCVAIDFTSSNGNPAHIDSNHRHDGNSLNDYEETITVIGAALSKYNEVNEYTVWGFGAKYGGVVRHIFQCGPTATVKGVDGILAAYQSVFESDLIMSGPTVFTQVLQAAASKAKRNHDVIRERPRYTVLLVITDGIMDNFEETVERLSLYSSLPLSIIFVGVGRSDFALMYQLCQSRNEACRSIATFVEFRQQQQNASALGEAALCNIPIQLCQYMQLQGI